ncbi:hypothetical protein EDB84DRAFT_851045 [Lactarius hengduanensis]|nr:hypothetical protein EDB84DRAFT_851045 [Lactarius hengduanensis]
MATSDSPRDMESQSEAPRRRMSHFPVINGNGDGRKTREKKRREAAEYGDTSAVYWKLYVSEAEESDQKLVDNLSGDTNSMLILNGLFSAIVASFIIETYKFLQPDNSQRTVDLLSQLVAEPNSTQPSSQDPNPQPFTPSNLAIRLNILMFLSLFLNMISVLASVLIQQWCREFMKYAYPRAAPHKRGRVRTYLYRGINQFQMRTFMYGVHVLVHVSVFLFFWALSDFLYTINPTVGAVARNCLFTLVAVYMALSVSPLIITNSPYHTALTTPLQYGGMALLFFCRFLWRLLRGLPIGRLTIRGFFEGLRVDRTHVLLEEVDAIAAQLDPDAMEWMFTDNDFSDTDMDKFLEGLPGYIHSPLTDTDHLPKVLTAGYILKRIREHFMTCATSLELSEEACVNRVVACVNSLRTIFKISAEQPRNRDEDNTQKEYIQGIIDGLNALCDGQDSIVALRASCVRGLAFRGLLAQSTESEGESAPTHRFPSYLVPLYTFFSSRGNTSSTSKEDVGDPPAEVSEQPTMAVDQRRRRALLCDGPLINLTLLAKAILSNDDVDPSDLSLCWKTLDLLRTGLGIALVEVSDPALALFDQVHNETRRRVQAEERGFHIIPLLEILDAVARGRRLSVVLRDHPKFRSKPDSVFEKEHLRNAEIFQAFASCFPAFVSKNPQKIMEFVEDLVCYDELWTTLQAVLGNSYRSDSPIPEKLRIFDTCCEVIDEVFIALENSQKVDWRVPEFGPLAHHFELFVTNCFQGTFVSRGTAFRVGLIKARFCKAVLLQFMREVDIEGAMVFRSQWDVAALARLFFTLGVGNEEDADFWKQFVDGGQIGAEFMVKAHDMLDVAERDGSLLNFIKLGHLATTAVPFEGSGLKDAEFGKLVDLLQKMMDDPALPLQLASVHVWEDLSQLRDKVREISAKISDDDKAKLQALLAKIDTVHDQGPYAVQAPSQSNHTQAQASGISSAAVQARGSSQELVPGHDGSSPASASTAVAPYQYVASPNGSSGDILAEARSEHTNSTSDNSRNEYVNLYSVPYPHLPSQAARGGVTRTLSVVPSHLLGSAPPESPGTTPIDPSSPYVRDNSQPRLAPVYYPPRQNSLGSSSSRSSPPSMFRPPRKGYTTSPSAGIDSPSSSPNLNEIVRSSSPLTSPVIPNE